MTLVLDASALVAALIDAGPSGETASARLSGEDLAAPHLLPAEVGNVLRRLSRSGQLSGDAASLAHADLLDLPVMLFPYEPFAARVWALRENLGTYDAWYVALAEELSAPLLTLNQRLAAAPGLRCEVVLAAP